MDYLKTQLANYTVICHYFHIDKFRVSGCSIITNSQPTPVLLIGKSHGLKSLVGCSPWGHKESNTTEQLSLFTYMHWRRKWQPTPLFLSGESHRLWAAIYGVAQSRTRLKWLSSSSRSRVLQGLPWWPNSKPAMQGLWIQFPSQDPLEEKRATLSSILAWEMPWTEESGRPSSTGSQEMHKT